MTKKRIWTLVTVLTLVTAIFATCLCGIFGVFSNEEQKYIVHQAESEYKIVISQNAKSVEKAAGQELQHFFKEATGIELPIVTDDGLTAGGKYFSVGETSLVANEVRTSITGIKSQGYVLKTVGDTIYAIGGSAEGTLYGVYRFLKEAFNYEYYFTEMYSLNTGIGDLPLTVYDIKAEPDIGAMSTPSIGFIMHNSTNRQRFMCISSSSWCIPANGSTEVHNLFRITPIELYEEHPKWFSDNKQTGCFTAHGDTTEYQALLEHYFNVAVKGMKISSAETFLVSQPDNCGFCGCAGCTKLKETVGGNSGILVNFCNDLSRKLLSWFQTEEGRPYKRDLKVLFLAYQACASAPSGNITCDDNVGVFIAFDSYRSSYSFEEDSHNKSLYNIVQAWKAKTKNFVFWVYDCNMNQYFYPYDTSAYKQDFYRLMKEVGTVVINDQSQTQNHNATAWGNLKSYISTKLRWDVNADVEKLTVNFFKVCYKDAWQTMYGVYSQVKAHWAYLKYKESTGELLDKNNDLRSIFGNLNNTDYWSRTMVESWIAQFEKAFEEIKPLATTDKETYDKVYSLIAVEMASPIFILLKNYRSEFSSIEYAALGQRFKDYVNAAGIEFYADGMTSNMADLYETLGI